MNTGVGSIIRPPARTSKRKCGVRWLAALVIIYLATFLRVEEEGRYQNTLQTWIEKLQHHREAAHLRATVLINGVAEVSGRAFDRLFGKRLFSLRGVGVSICFSLASCLLTLDVISETKFAKGQHASFELWALLLFFIMLGIFPAVMNPREGEYGVTWIWVTVIFLTTVVPLMQFADFVLATYGKTPVALLLGFTILIFCLSFLTDVTYIALTRWMLRWVSDTRSLWKTIAIILANTLLAVLMLVPPVAIGVWILLRSAGRTAPTFIGAGLIMGVTLNTIDLLACSVFFLVLLAVLIHRLVWPFVERPVYAAARYGILNNKTLLWGVAGILLLAPRGASILKLVLSKLLG
jgi:hypothetical protein